MSGIRRMIVANCAHKKDWLQMAFEAYPELKPYKANLLAAHAIDPDIEKTFDGRGRWLVNIGVQSYIPLGLSSTDGCFTIKAKAKESKNSSQVVLNRGTEVAQWFGGNSIWSIGGGIVLSVPITTEVENTIFFNGNQQSLYYNKALVGVRSMTKVAEPIELYCSDTRFCTQFAVRYLRRSNTLNSPTTNFYIPIIKNNIPQMIDLITMTYPTKVGTFTIE